MITIIEADRHAAALSAGKIYGNRIAEKIRNGDNDEHHLVQGYAVHRIETMNACARLAETYSWQDEVLTENTCCAATCCDVADRIRREVV